MKDNRHTVVPEPDGRDDYTRIKERAPEILEAEKRNPPEDDSHKKVVEKDESETGPGGTGW